MFEPGRQSLAEWGPLAKTKKKLRNDSESNIYP